MLLGAGSVLRTLRRGAYGCIDILDHMHAVPQALVYGNALLLETLKDL